MSFQILDEAQIHYFIEIGILSHIQAVFKFHISQNVSKSRSCLISQLCGDFVPALCFSMQDGVIYMHRPPEHFTVDVIYLQAEERGLSKRKTVELLAIVQT